VEQPDGTYWMPLFVVLADGASLDTALIDALQTTISQNVSHRHVPDEVIAVPGIPHTRTGKKLEVPIKRLFQGAALTSVVNPDAVDDTGHLVAFNELAQHRRQAHVQ
jgi:acetoacetyl-CoA synthetase